jgi:hypothetical protein
MLFLDGHFTREEDLHPGGGTDGRH